MQAAARSPNLGVLGPDASPVSVPAKDISFLHQPSLYHRLPPPPQYDPRGSFNPNNVQVDAMIPSLLSSHNYRAAAEASAFYLSHSPAPSHSASFALFYVRLASLVLLNCTVIAAQESAVLEDINTPFYRPANPTSGVVDNDQLSESGGSILPWELQALWARLTGIAHGDVRRSVIAYHDLARHARHAYQSCTIDRTQERLKWRRRLRALGLGLASVLVEAGDLQGAASHLERLRSSEQISRMRNSNSTEGSSLEKSNDLIKQLKDPPKEMTRATISSRLALIYLALGDIDAASQCLRRKSPYSSLNSHEQSSEPADDDPPPLLRPLISIVTGEYEDAVEQLRALLSPPPTAKDTSVDDPNLQHPKRAGDSASNTDQALIRQNLAVALFYTGRVDETIAMLERLVDGDGGGDETQHPRSFHALTFNLATCFELTTEKAGAKKLALAERMGKGMKETGSLAERDAGAFKI